ncbi:MAG TPA: HXXEE domain-containing protein [Candidatus Polarisedimenticolaceae bacterium]|nr:HXXEE domain-containing protein [Candidatus Polarisedimenticolaceae bacterium]
MSISWWPMVAAVLHIVEEFVFPGGFAEWDRSYRPAFRKSITSRFHVWINALLLFVCLAVGAAGPTPNGVAGWLTLSALLASNAVFHLVGTIRTKRYSPGLATGLGLYLPMALYGYPHFLRTGQASLGTAVVAFAIGASYHLWASMAHARRAAAAR